MTEAEPLEQVARTWARFRGRKFSYFSGCDYFRIASHPKMIRAVRKGVRQYGLNVAASRLTTGNHELYCELERALARFFRAQDALLVSTGYLSNLVVAQALAGNFSHVLMDDLAHPSLVDAARFFDCPVMKFKHRDAKHLAHSIHRCGPEARQILLTDGMFSRDGSVAPLAEYASVLPKDAWMLVDDAHGAGVLGRTGKGSLEHERVPRARIIQTITLSKAFGAYGGAILGTTTLRRRIIDRSGLFAGSTPLPLPLACAALRAIQLIKTDKRLTQRLAENTSHVRRVLENSGVRITTAPGPIFSIFPRNTRKAVELSKSLLSAGIFPPLIHYPGGPSTGYFRFAISSEHTRKQLDNLVNCLAKNLNRRGGNQ